MTLPAIADGTVPGAVTTVPVSFPPLTGSHFMVTFTGVRPEYAANYYSAGPLALPLGIAEIGIPGARTATTPADLPGTCVSNLLTIDGQPIDVSVVGSAQHALQNGEAQLVPCGPDANGITLGAGPHIVQTAAGHNPPCASTPATCTGWNIDQLVLDSAAGGGAGPAVFPTSAGTPQLAATQPGASPSVTATSSHIDAHSGDVTGATRSFELVLGQSVNKGWQAVAQPGPGAAPGSHPVNLGTPHLVDGFANGWQVSEADLQPRRRPRLRGRADLDPPTGGLGRPGAVRRHPGAVPRPRLPPPAAPDVGCGRGCPAACAGRPAPTRPNDRPCPSTPPLWRCPPRRRPRTNDPAAGSASPGRWSSAP